MSATWENVEPNLVLKGKEMVRLGGPGFELTTGYRGMPEQIRLYAVMLAGIVRFGSKAKAQAAGVAVAAIPGTSQHGKKPALAIDVGCRPDQIELQTQLAKKLGLKRTVPGEHWHFENDPSVPPPTTTPEPQPEEEEDMPRYADDYTWDDGAKVQVFPDGSVKCFGAKSYGSMFSLKPEFKITFSRADAIRPINSKDSQAGYIVCDEDGEEWKFDETAFKFFKERK
jgi:hypothetical protein